MKVYADSKVLSTKVISMVRELESLQHHCIYLLKDVKPPALTMESSWYENYKILVEGIDAVRRDALNFMEVFRGDNG